MEFTFHQVWQFSLYFPSADIIFFHVYQTTSLAQAVAISILAHSHLQKVE